MSSLQLFFFSFFVWEQKSLALSFDSFSSSEQIRIWPALKMLRLQCTLQGIHQCENQQAIRVENEKMSNDLLSRKFNAFFADGKIDNSQPILR